VVGVGSGRALGSIRVPAGKKVGYSIEMRPVIQCTPRYFYHCSQNRNTAVEAQRACNREARKQIVKIQPYRGLQPSAHIFSQRYTQVIHRNIYPLEGVAMQVKK